MCQKGRFLQRKSYIMFHHKQKLAVHALVQCLQQIHTIIINVITKFNVKFARPTLNCASSTTVAIYNAYQSIFVVMVNHATLVMKLFLQVFNCQHISTHIGILCTYCHVDYRNMKKAEFNLRCINNPIYSPSFRGVISSNSKQGMQINYNYLYT